MGKGPMSFPHNCNLLQVHDRGSVSADPGLFVISNISTRAAAVWTKGTRTHLVSPLHVSILSNLTSFHEDSKHKFKIDRFGQSTESTRAGYGQTSRSGSLCGGCLRSTRKKIHVTYQLPSWQFRGCRKADCSNGASRAGCPSETRLYLFQRQHNNQFRHRITLPTIE